MVDGEATRESLSRAQRLQNPLFLVELDSFTFIGGWDGTPHEHVRHPGRPLVCQWARPIHSLLPLHPTSDQMIAGWMLSCSTSDALCFSHA